MRAMMKMPLDPTIADRADRLAARYAAGVREDTIEHPIPGIADMLSNGIIQQFPSRFRSAKPPHLPDGQASRSSGAGGP
jgi:hypothetical protein